MVGAMGAIAFVGQKGGMGKTTAALVLASELHARGRKVLLVDADPQGSSRVWADVMAELGKVPPTVVAADETMHKSRALAVAMAEHEYTVIDCPPQLGAIQRAALMVCDLAVVPCGQSEIDGWSMTPSVKLMRAAIEARSGLSAVVLLTRTQAQTKLGRTARDILTPLGVPLLKAELGYRNGYQAFPGAGCSATEYAPAGDPMVAEVRAFVTETLKELRRAQASAEENSKSSPRAPARR